MTAKIEFFPVDNGDMGLLTLESGRKILIDVDIRKKSESDGDAAVDVAALLKDRLDRDSQGRLYVDAFLLTHPDQDHCRGLVQHFHLGKPSDWEEENDKILIREMWSSPIIFRRKKSVKGELCADAEAWWKEARRRVKTYREGNIEDGDRILILGEDKNGKTDDLADILVKADEEIVKVCGVEDGTFRAWLLAPQLVSEQDAEQLDGKNTSSTIIRFSIQSGDDAEAGKFLTGGDAEVANWERVWARNKGRTERLSYNVLLVPHHCSWRSLSYDSWSDKKEDAEVSEDARSALGQAKNKAFLISSSCGIEDNDIDPPCIRAKREYTKIANECDGEFLCLADECDDDVLLLEITEAGPRRGKGSKSEGACEALVAERAAPRMTEKRGGGRYA